MPAEELATQRLYRAHYDGPEGDGGFRLTLRLQTLDRGQAQANALGRKLWSLEADGDTGLLHGRSSYVRAEPGILITTLELQRDKAEISVETLTALTPREREIALLVVEGLSDRLIADRLYLSHHPVSQYVKRIYRKLDVRGRAEAVARGRSRRPDSTGWTCRRAASWRCWTCQIR